MQKTAQTQIGSGSPLTTLFKFSNVDIEHVSEGIFKVSFLTRKSWIPPIGLMKELDIGLLTMGVNSTDNTLFVLLRVETKGCTGVIKN